MSALKVIGIVLAVILALAAISAAAVGIGIVTLPWHTVTAQVDSAHEIVDTVNDADNAIYNYEWFKTQHEKIIAAEKNAQVTHDSMNQFKADFGEPKDWDWQTKQMYNQKSTTFAGQQQHYNDLVAEYNARSEMSTRNIFDDKLPMHVDKMLW